MPRLLWFLLRVVTLEPGVGIVRKPQILLKVGDVAEVEIEGIGTLKTQ